MITIKVPRWMRAPLLALLCSVVLLIGTRAISAETNAPPAPPSATATATVAAPAKPAASKSEADDSDSDDKSDSSHHAAHFEFHTEPGDTFMDDLIPLFAIGMSLGMPIIIIALVLYFRYRQRQDNIALVREFLAKGQPVPPELMSATGRAFPVSAAGARCDLNKGFKLTFIGLGITAAFYVSDPHSTWWGWGLIPFIMGIGYLLSAFVQRRDATRDAPLPPPPGNPPQS